MANRAARSFIKRSLNASVSDDEMNGPDAYENFAAFAVRRASKPIEKIYAPNDKHRRRTMR